MAGCDIDEIKDFIDCIYMNECEKISGGLDLIYAIGEYDGDYYLCICSNKKSGKFSADWICGREIDSAVIDQNELTGEVLYGLQRGRSNNTGGFIMAALLDLGLVCARVGSYYEHVPLTTFKSVVEKRLKE